MKYHCSMYDKNNQLFSLPHEHPIFACKSFSRCKRFGKRFSKQNTALAIRVAVLRIESIEGIFIVNM